MVKDDDNILPVEGDWGVVDAASRMNGSKPAEDDLRAIKKRDVKGWRRVVIVICKVAEVGRANLSPTIIASLRDGIYELKRHPYRVGCFFVGNECFLTHIFRKRKGAAYVVKETKTAIKIRDEHIRSSEKERR